MDEWMRVMLKVCLTVAWVAYIPCENPHTLRSLGTSTLWQPVLQNCRFLLASLSAHQREIDALFAAK